VLADKPKRRRLLAICVALLSMGLAPAASTLAGTPLGLPSTPSDSSDSPALAELGQRLFQDRRLSVDGTISCASCHIPEQQFTDGRATARGLGGKELTRKTPSLLNVRFQTSLFWDGRAPDLATQVRTPLLGPVEHGLRDERAVGEVVRRDDSYVKAFTRLLHVSRNDLSMREVTTALVAFERKLLSGDSPFDRYLYSHDLKSMNAAAVRGLALFRGRALCVSCHRIGDNSALFTDNEFHASPLPIPTSALANLGELTSKVSAMRADGDADGLNALVASDRDTAALGRFVVTQAPKDIGSYKTPSLRNVALLGPYMHDGSVATLPQAIEIELYSRTERNYPLVLTEDERADLLQFLQALTSTGIEK
jgi:cytochrome c peroxidase